MRLADFFGFSRKREEPAAQQAEPQPQPQANGSASIPVRTSGSLVLYKPAADPMSVATVYRCAKILSDSVACLRLRCERFSSGVYVDDTSSPLSYLLSVQPQPNMSAYDFWAFAVQQMIFFGNAYIYPRRINGRITDLVLCSTGSVGHDSLNGKYTISDVYNGVCGTFAEEDIIHLYLHTHDGRTGVSVLSHARQTVGIAAAGDTETGNRFTNGGNVRGIISNDKSVVGFGEYQDEQLARTAEDVDGRFRGGERIVSLPGQVDFKQISLSSTDMQFLESRKFTVREICRFFGVHPSFVYDDSASNYKSAEQSNTMLLSYTLNPILRRIEAEFNRKLILPEDFGKRKFEFDRRDIYSLDLGSRAAYQKQTIESGIYTVNDWRRIENQPIIDGGDEVYLSANLAPLGSPKLSGNNQKQEI